MEGIYSTGLVVLSFAIAVLGSYSAFDITARMSADTISKQRVQWLIAAALAMGTTIWAAHFIGMLAFTLPIPMAYDIPATIGSHIVAVLTSGTALYLVSRQQLTLPRLAGGSLLMGCGIIAMHYFGMASLVVLPAPHHDSFYIVLSSTTALGLSALAMTMMFKLRTASTHQSRWMKLASVTVMSAAIVGMHYNGMAATSFAADSVAISGPHSLDNSLLAGTIASFTFLLVAVLVILSAFEAGGRSSRFGLTLLVVGSIIPMLVMTVLFAFYEYNRERGTVIESSLAKVRTINESITYHLASVESTLQVIAHTTPLVSGNLQGFQGNAARLALSTNIEGLFLVDADGQMVMQTMWPYSDSASALPARSIRHQAVFREGNTVISGLIKNDVLHMPHVTVTVPIWQDGTVTYALGAFVSAARLNTLLTRMHLPEGWLSAIFDTEGQFIARNLDASFWVGKKGPATLLQGFEGASEGTVETVAVSGIEVIAPFVRSSNSGWVIAIGIPENVLIADIKRTFLLLATFTLLFLMISLYLAWTLSDHIVTAIRSLVRPAQALGRNQVVTVPPLYLKELNEVGKALQEASELLRQTTHEANHDTLTGLANRSLFLHLTKQHLAHCDRNGNSLAILFIDLDGFKSVNDNYGHATGDALLKAAAARIQVTLRQTDAAARIGGDEFAAVLADVDAHGASIVGEKLVKALSTPFPLGSDTIQISASIGIAMRNRDGLTAEELIAKADEAMYEAKLAGKKRCVLASPL